MTEADKALVVSTAMTAVRNLRISSALKRNGDTLKITTTLKYDYGNGATETLATSNSEVYLGDLR